MKNFLVGLLCIIVICLCVMMGFMYKKMVDLEKASTTEKIQEQELISNEASSDENNVVDTINTNSQIAYRKVAFDGSKVKNAISGVKYEETGENYISSTEFHVNVIQEGERVFVTTNGFEEKYNWLNGVSGIKDVEHKEITGFSGEVVSYFLAAEGQDITPPTILFLMADGTVEYVKSIEMLKNNNFTSKGKISGLTNINRFTFINVLDINGGGGHYSTADIDNDGYAYDIFTMNID